MDFNYLEYLINILSKTFFLFIFLKEGYFVLCDCEYTRMTIKETYNKINGQIYFNIILF